MANPSPEASTLANSEHTRLPVIPIVKQAFAIPFKNAASLLRALFVTGLALTTLEVLSERVDLPGGALAEFGYTIAYGLVFTLFAVTAHRLILRGPGSVPKFGVLIWSGREWRFIGWGILAYFYFVLLTGVVMLVVGLLAVELCIEGRWYWLLGLTGVLPGMYVFARLSVLFPAAATETRVGWDWAWDATQGNGWRLVLLVGLLPAVLSAAPVLVYGKHLVTDVVLTILTMVLAVIEIAALSLSFRFLVKDGLEAGGAGLSEIEPG